MSAEERDDFTDPKWEDEAITLTAYVVTGDQIMLDHIWWEVIERSLTSGATRFALLRMDEDHVETHVIPNERSLYRRKRIWST